MNDKGRRTKPTPEVKEQILDALRLGGYFEVACRYAGAAVSTGMGWLQRARGEHPTRPQMPFCAEFMVSSQSFQGNLVSQHIQSRSVTMV
jgi:hypothetical protein